MELSPEDVDGLQQGGVYDLKRPQRVPGWSPETLQRLLAAGLIRVQVEGLGGDLVTLSGGATFHYARTPLHR